MSGLPYLRDALPFMAIVAPLVGALLVIAVSRMSPLSVRPIAYSNALLTTSIVVAAVCCYEPSRRTEADRPESTQMIGGLRWRPLGNRTGQHTTLPARLEVPHAGEPDSVKPTTPTASGYPLGIDLRLSFGVNGLTIWPALWTTLATLIALAFPGQRAEKSMAMYGAVILVVESLLLASILSRDAVVSLIAFEMAVLPISLLIGVFGAEERRDVAARFLGHQWIGGMLTLAGVTLIAASGPWMQRDLVPRRTAISTAIQPLAERLQALLARSEIAVQLWSDVSAVCLLLMLLGFAVRCALVPFHGWLRSTMQTAPCGVAAIIVIALPQAALSAWIELALPLFASETVSLAWPLGLMAVAGLIHSGLLAASARDLRSLSVALSMSGLLFAAMTLRVPTREGTAGAMLLAQTISLSSAILMILHGRFSQQSRTSRIEANRVRDGQYAHLMPNDSPLGRSPSNTESMEHEQLRTHATIVTNRFRYQPRMAAILLATLITSGVMLGMSSAGSLLSLSTLAGEELAFAMCCIAVSLGVTWSMLNVTQHTIASHSDQSDLTFAECATIAPLVLGLFVMTFFPSLVLSRTEPTLAVILQRIERISSN